jgi:A/G-specific adenine glycosylase
MKEGYFSKKIAEWYEEYHRKLPWRASKDPYRIWLSEIILQQTRVSQGLPYYNKFIQNYPNIKVLAAAKEQEVLRHWQGLGYYTRARNLHACAKTIVKHHDGQFPRSFDALRRLPGIGVYTAAAVASFAFGERVAVVDGNVQRVLARIFGVEMEVTSADGKKHFWRLAQELISKDNPARHNQAIMEFGAMQCIPRNPPCDSCIFKNNCVAFKSQTQSLFPVKKKKQKAARRYFYYFLLEQNKKLFMVERKGQDIWKGLHDFPLHEEAKSSAAKKIIRKVFANKQGDSITKGFSISKSYKQVLTHQIIMARFIEVRSSDGKLPVHPFQKLEGTWHSAMSLEKIPKPVLISRFLRDRSIL